jgi:hypothetical protein
MWNQRNRVCLDQVRPVHADGDIWLRISNCLAKTISASAAHAVETSSQTLSDLREVFIIDSVFGGGRRGGNQDELMRFSQQVDRRQQPSSTA